MHGIKHNLQQMIDWLPKVKQSIWHKRFFTFLTELDILKHWSCYMYFYVLPWSQGANEHNLNIKWKLQMSWTINPICFKFSSGSTLAESLYTSCALSNFWAGKKIKLTPSDGNYSIFMFDFYQLAGHFRYLRTWKYQKVLFSSIEKL